MSTLLAFDFGTKSIGVAIAQSVTGTAAPLPALTARDGIPEWQQIQSLIQQWQPQLLVIGLPLNMDGTDQPITQAARKFAQRLHGRFGLAVEHCDERLSSAEARERLFELGGYKKLEKAKVDSVAACLIAESWLRAQQH